LVCLRRELNWKVNRLNEINQGINHFNNMLFQFEHNNLPAFIMEHTSKEKINKKITELRLEKKETIQSIREYQIQERNILKILERRELK
jgi:methionine salvage enolase-phosphatase E1